MERTHLVHIYLQNKLSSKMFRKLDHLCLECECREGLGNWLMDFLLHVVMDTVTDLTEEREHSLIIPDQV